MKIWYIRHNDQSLGPYTIEELKTLSATKEDFVWKEGLSDWKPAKEFPELDELFTQPAPPPFNQSQSYSYSKTNPDHISLYNSYSSPKKKNNTALKAVGWTGTIILLILLGFYLYNQSQSSPYYAPYEEKTPEQLRAEPAESERQNPGKYIAGESKMRTNLIGEKVIEGTVVNNATVAIFKDIVLDISFKSKTGAVISNQQFTIYELLSPGQSAKFKFKTFTSKAVKDYQASILTASAVSN